MAPTKIMLIRHAEKPDKDAGGQVSGVDENGAEDNAELAVSGWQRAGALARFFAPVADRPKGTIIENPNRLFAAGPNAKDPSKRAVHTLAPLSGIGGVEIVTKFGVGDEPALAAAIFEQVGVVLAAWEHKNIKHVVEALTNRAVKSPHWPGDRFDMVLVLTPSPAWSLRQVPQLLLPGDRSDPMPETGED